MTTAVTLTFPEGASTGTTTVTPDPSPSPLPSEFELAGSNLAFEISTTVTYTPPIIIAFQVPPPLDVTTLTVLHWNTTTSTWDDVTCPIPNPGPTPDTTTNTIYASVSSLSPFVIARRIACQFSSSITANFNGTQINSGRYMWFNSVLKPSGLGSQPVTIYFTQQTITSANFTLSVPDASVTFDPAATFATTTFSGGMWVTRVPSSGLAGNTFLSALGYSVPANLPGGIHNVTWNGTISSDTPGVSAQWKWGAAVYTNFTSDSNALGVKPVDDNKKNPYLNSDHAGTPENFKPFVIGGATGGGGANYTGGLSGTAAVGPCRP